MLTVTIDIDPAALIAVLGKLPKALDPRRIPMRSAMSAAADSLMRWEQGRFVSASGGDGTWRDLAPVTKLKRVERQAKLAKTKKTRGELSRVAASAQLPILNVTGTLEAGLFERGGPGHFLEFDSEGVREGVSGGAHPDAPISVGELAFVHHYGSAARHIPARPVMGEPDARAMADMQEFISVGVSDTFAALSRNVGGDAATA